MTTPTLADRLDIVRDAHIGSFSSASADDHCEALRLELESDGIIVRFESLGSCDPFWNALRHNILGIPYTSVSANWTLSNTMILFVSLSERSLAVAEIDAMIATLDYRSL